MREGRELANSLEVVARQLGSIQKRRYEMLASAQQSPYRVLVCEAGTRCSDCRDLPRHGNDDEILVLAALEACPLQPELEHLLDIVDFVEERLISRFDSRRGFRTTRLTHGFSALKSALLRQKSRMPRFRRSDFDPEPEMVTFHYTYHCTYRLKQLIRKWEFEDVPNARFLEASSIRKLPRERRCIAGLKEPFEIVFRISGPEDGLVRSEDIRRIRAFRRTAQAKCEPDYSTRVSGEERKSAFQEEA